MTPICVRCQQGGGVVACPWCRAAVPQRERTASGPRLPDAARPRGAREMTAYYNDNDRHVAQWLRNLIAAGLLPKGDVMLSGRGLPESSAYGQGVYGKWGTEPILAQAICRLPLTAAPLPAQTLVCALPQAPLIPHRTHRSEGRLGSIRRIGAMRYLARSSPLCADGKSPAGGDGAHGSFGRFLRSACGDTMRSISTYLPALSLVVSSLRKHGRHAHLLAFRREPSGTSSYKLPSNTDGLDDRRPGACCTVCK